MQKMRRREVERVSLALTLASFCISVAGCPDFSSLQSDEQTPVSGDAASGPNSEAGTTDATSLGDGASAPNDAGAEADAPVVAPPNGFALTLTPPHVTLDPSDSTDVTVTVVRDVAFQDAVDVTVQGLGADLTTNPPTVTIPASAMSGSFTIVASNSAKVPADVAVKVIGISKKDSSLSATTELGVRVGSFFTAATTSTSVTLPPWTTELEIKVWGAGGGAGGAISTEPGPFWGGYGGPGGFARARVAVSASQALTVTVGTGGASGQASFGGASTHNGGGDGGYSAVAQGATMLVVAGGGGGGGGAQAYNNSGHCYGDSFGIYALAGGGGDGQASGANPQRSATKTAPGVADLDGGASPGTSLAGGNASYSAIAGGTPGGGAGGTADDGCWGSQGGGGGGGGGWFGGASGVGRQGIYGSHVSGGGGGSGHVIAGAKNVVQVNDTTRTSDPDYAAPAGNGGTRGADDAGAGAGSPGRVVIRFAKP